MGNNPSSLSGSCVSVCRRRLSFPIFVCVLVRLRLIVSFFCREEKGPASLFLLLQEGVRDDLAAVDGADDDQEGAAHNDEAEGAGRLVSFVVCG